ncbi:MAG: radical SAM protein, partial [Planctomycetota bacterium]
MELVQVFGKDDLATLYVVRLRQGEGYLVECVESLQPPKPRSQKWVLIVSTLFGCPVRCRMCDAGGWYRGGLTATEIMDQIRFLVKNRFNGVSVPVEKFKIQFAR